MPTALQPEVIEIIGNLATKYGFRKLDQILEYAVKISWPACRRTCARMAVAMTDYRRNSSFPDHDIEVREISRDQFEQAMVGHH